MPSRALLLVTVLLSACSSTWKAEDQDGDGYAPSEGDCWEGEGGAAINPGATETWYDGVDQDCDGSGDYDQDGDGVDGAADDSGEDCLDTDPTAYPGAEDAWYDGVDSDCGGEDDFDQDGDGFAGAADGSGEDCDDLNPDLNPGVEEVWYDGIDQNCDGNDTDQDGDGYAVTEDCDDTNEELFPDFSIEEIWYNGEDENCDGNDGDQDGDGYVSDDYAATYDWEVHNAHLGTGDCWDDAVDTGDVPAEFEPINDFGSVGPDEVGPDATERWYDAVDQDCDGGSDFDQDGDGYDTEFYPNREGELGDDCIDGSDLDDENPGLLEPFDVSPSATETWYDGTDQDCAGDDDFDQDTDGYQAAGYGEGSDDDCADDQPDINPGAREDCSTSADDDCDDDTNDVGARGCTTYYTDADSDDFGAGSGACLCVTTTTYEVTNDDDCDDTDADINPDATEGVGDEVDQDCDGGEICYLDYDNDGYAVDGDTKTSTDTDCDDSREALATEPDGDCDDESATINPGATETTGDEIDQDCDDRETCYADGDNDGYRTTSTKTSSDEDCDDSGEASSSVTSGDCDDSDSGVSPGDAEITGDEIDQNCDDKEVCYVDADNDGYRLSTTVTGTDEDCDDSGEALASEPDDDCADTDEDTFPGASETCEDDVVNDCDGDEVDALLECDWDAAPAVTTATARRSGGAASDVAGTRVAFGGDVDGDGDDELLISSTGAATSSGRIYVVAGSPSGNGALSSSTYYSYFYTGAATGDQLGTGLAAGLDTDDDGYGDLLVGAPYNNDGGGDAGAAYLIDGPLPASGTMSASIYAAELTGLAGGDYAGIAVLGAGDVNGDGNDDVVIGAEKGDSGGSNGGDAYLILGPLASGGLGAAAESTWGGSYSGEKAGKALAAGDVDGDGTPDLFIGAPSARVGSSSNSRGRSYVMFGPATTEGELSDVADVDLQGAADDDTSGTSLACGDVDGDGADDLLVGAPGVDAGASGGGAAYLVLGGSSLPSAALTLSSADVVLTGVAASDAAGTTVAAADLTGDGLAEILVGAPGADGSGTDRGRVYLFFGEDVASGSLSGANVIYSGEANSDALGSSLAAGGDADEDGYLDLLFGAPSADPSSGSNAGMVYFFPGTGY